MEAWQDPGLGAAGYGDDEVVAVQSGALCAFAVSAVLGALVRLVIEGDQRIHILAGFQKDAAPATAVAAIRPAFIDVFFPPK